jgi:hypothetical protein
MGAKTVCLPTVVLTSGAVAALIEPRQATPFRSSSTFTTKLRILAALGNFLSTEQAHFGHFLEETQVE